MCNMTAFSIIIPHDAGKCYPRVEVFVCKKTARTKTGQSCWESVVQAWSSSSLRRRISGAIFSRSRFTIRLYRG